MSVEYNAAASDERLIERFGGEIDDLTSRLAEHERKIELLKANVVHLVDTIDKNNEIYKKLIYLLVDEAEKHEAMIYKVVQHLPGDLFEDDDLIDTNLL